MATRKTASKNSATQKIDPKAFEEYDFDNLEIVPTDQAELWDFSIEGNEILDGILKAIRVVETTQKKGNKTIKKAQKIAEFAIRGGGNAAVFESYNLSKLFHEELYGFPFRIIYKGTVNIKGGRKLKNFEIRTTQQVLDIMEKVHKEK